MEEVRDHEPYMALDGGPDGLSFYRRIVSLAPRYLNPGGSLLFEIGFDEGQDVTRMLRQAGFRDVRIIRDLNGLERVVSSVFPGDDPCQE
jgi:release factor glutamine methyltransferase